MSPVERSRFMRRSTRTEQRYRGGASSEGQGDDWFNRRANAAFPEIAEVISE
jgi:hypothetical protein